MAFMPLGTTLFLNLPMEAKIGYYTMPMPNPDRDVAGTDHPGHSGLHGQLMVSLFSESLLKQAFRSLFHRKQKELTHKKNKVCNATFSCFYS